MGTGEKSRGLRLGRAMKTSSHTLVRLGGWLLVTCFLGCWFAGTAAELVATKSVVASDTLEAFVRSQIPRMTNAGGIITSQKCQSCHPDEHSSWHKSYHRTMTQPALPGMVLGSFDGSKIISQGLEYRVFQSNGVYFAEMPDPDVMMYVVQGGRKLAFDKIPRVKRPVEMTTGSHNYQTYWVTSPRYPGLMQTLPLVYLPADKQWIPREDAFMHGAADGKRFITQWNHHCIRCHSTEGNPGLDEKTGMLKSTVGEFGIACEACHGPGEKHALKHAKEVGRAVQSRADRRDDSIVNPARLDHDRGSQVCGQCHGVYVMREEFAMASANQGPMYHPGEDIHKTRYYIQHPRLDPKPERMADFERNPDFFQERWWDDGTILAGGREYTAMKDSACFTRGKMSCMSCHSMHESDPNDQLKAGMEGPAACVKCHSEAKYTTELTKHTFHEKDSVGSNCLNCHMPHTTYALFKGIRSHQIQSPRVDRSVRYGTPNACNLCHLDRTLEWTQEQLATRYGQPKVELTAEQQRTAGGVLWAIQGNAAQRAIAAWHLGWEPAQKASGTDWMAPINARLLNDPYGVVRYVAARSLKTLPGYGEFQFNFLDAETNRTARVQDATRRWMESSSGKSARPAVLIGAGGKLDSGRLGELERTRDNRSVTIKE